MCPTRMSSVTYFKGTQPGNMLVCQSVCFEEFRFLGEKRRKKFKKLKGFRYPPDTKAFCSSRSLNRRLINQFNNDSNHLPEHNANPTKLLILNLTNKDCLPTIKFTKQLQVWRVVSHFLSVPYNVSTCNPTRN